MRGRRLLIHVVAGLALPGLISCTPYRIEYHPRPAFYKEASEQELLDQVRLEDGTLIRFREQDPFGDGPQVGNEGESGSSATTDIRLESSDGSVVLRAAAPEHVLAHAKRCIRQREYRLLWDQLLADRTRGAYQREGKDFEDFAKFCEDNRPAMMETFNRMGFALYSTDVVQEAIQPNGVRYRMHPRLGDQFVFTEFDVVRETSGFKWLMIR